MEKQINTKLSLAGCWKMVNAIQCGKDAQEIRERCRIAENWLTANEIIDNDEYDDLMNAVVYMHRESYHTS